MQASFTIRCLLVAVCSSTFATGCASLTDNSSKSGSKKKEGWSWFKKKEYQEPKSMVAIWTEDTLVQPGKPITRGFGGRIYFYNEKSQAIPVDGELVVYGFEDTSAVAHGAAWPSEADLAKDAKKFKFTAEQFTQHFSQSQLGASYSVWIPWDAVGGEQKKVTLCPMFIGKSQRITRGETNSLTLSGKKPGDLFQPDGKLDALAQEVQTNLIQLASASIPTGPGTSLPQFSNSPLQARSSTPFNSQMRTTTIKMDHAVNAGLRTAPQTASQPTVNPQVAQLLQALQSNAAGSPTIGGGTNAPVGSPIVQTTQSLVPASNPTAGSWGAVLPPLGHGIPSTGWVQPGSAQPVSSPPLVGSPPNLFPAQGSTSAR